jgi:hypothetical protein
VKPPTMTLGEARAPMDRGLTASRGSLVTDKLLAKAWECRKKARPIRLA